MKYLYTITILCFLTSCSNYRGEQVEYYPNGKKKRVAFFVDRAQEKTCNIEYYESGKKKSENYSKENNLDGPFLEYYENGQIKIASFYVNGEKEGDHNEYYETGILQATAFFKNGKEEGEIKFYHPNGKLESVSFARDGMIQGKLLIYHDDGRLKAENFLKDDFIHYIKVFKYNDKKEVDTTEVEYRIKVELDRDTISIGEAVDISFDLSLPIHHWPSYDLIVEFDFTKNDSSALFYPIESMKLKNGVNKTSFVLHEPGSILLFGHLKFKETLITSLFEEEFFIKSD